MLPFMSAFRLQWLQFGNRQAEQDDEEGLRRRFWWRWMRLWNSIFVDILSSFSPGLWRPESPTYPTHFGCLGTSCARRPSWLP
mmetsp:Transcript_88073/g.184061  ORF Transcript_88073/g.184061 Transcript_88073/m.184061 type:complete len:83 (+) Transcript_88073:1291-1539(+)